MRRICVLAAIIVALCSGFDEVSGQSSGVVQVGGYTYSGDEFVFVLDRSGSTAWNGQIAGVQGVVTDALADLEPSQQFSVIAFNGSSLVFSAVLLPATAANVLSAQNWVSALAPLGQTCPVGALEDSFSILTSSAGEPAIFFFADGAEQCLGPPAGLIAIAQANVDFIPIHTLVGPTPVTDPDLGEWMLAIANDSDGSFVDLTVPIPDPYVRGDANGDGSINLADAVTILRFGFGLSTGPTCMRAHDVNADGVVEAIPDAIACLELLFVSGTPPLSVPYPDCGSTPPSSLTCEVSDCT